MVALYELYLNRIQGEKIMQEEMEVHDLGPANPIHRHSEGPYKHTQHEKDIQKVETRQEDNDINIPLLLGALIVMDNLT